MRLRISPWLWFSTAGLVSPLINAENPIIIQMGSDNPAIHADAPKAARNILLRPIIASESKETTVLRSPARVGRSQDEDKQKNTNQQDGVSDGE